MKILADIILNYLEKQEGFTVDASVRNPIERVSREVSRGDITWEEGLKKIHSQAKLYRLSSEKQRALKAEVEKNM
ncbi:MAG: hypothetical protein EOM19_00620 [Candidatus Moranbacteria bacterium]|nr:hypothetical protein [Candidatus Moranbacteria bacterium]